MRHNPLTTTSSPLCLVGVVLSCDHVWTMFDYTTRGDAQRGVQVAEVVTRLSTTLTLHTVQRGCPWSDQTYCNSLCTICSNCMCETVLLHKMQRNCSRHQGHPLVCPFYIQGCQSVQGAPRPMDWQVIHLQALNIPLIQWTPRATQS